MAPRGEIHLPPCLRPPLLVQARRATCQFPCTTSSKSLALRLLLRKWAALCDLPQEISSKRRDEESGISRICGQSVPGREVMPFPVPLASEAYPPPPAEPRTGRVPPGSRLHRCPRLAARSAPECVSSLGRGEGKVARPQPLPGRIRERRWYPSRSQGGSEVSVCGIGERKQKRS